MSTFSALRTSPKIEIQLEGPRRRSSYTTGSLIKGTVSITAHRDIPLGRIEISFQGVSQIKVEREFKPPRKKVQHNFLRLRQPVDDTIPKTLKKGHTTRIPFEFVVPERLLPQSCRHAKRNPHLHHSHTRLPPTLGDGDFTSDGIWISYSIQVALFKPWRWGVKALSTATKSVRVIPKVEEEPPVEVSGSSLYCTQKEELFGSPHPGRLFISVSQPKPIQTKTQKPSSYSAVEIETPTTMATMELKYIAMDEHTRPPKLHSVFSKIRAMTMYSATAWEDFPDLLSKDSMVLDGRGRHTRDVSLSKMSIESVRWMESSSGAGEYTASIVVPITVPLSKTTVLVPTFHSCLLSRVYTLDLDLSYFQSGKRLASRVSFRVPIQVTS